MVIQLLSKLSMLLGITGNYKNQRASSEVLFFILLGAYDI